VHRDLKPANILVAEGPEVPLERATLKVSDFGLVRRIDDEGDTRSGQMMGTPGYMAPEQARASHGQPLGPSVDVYALGVLLYEILCGELPYRGSSALETVHLMLSTEPPRPSGRVRLPRDLEVICLKCLEKEPARRYASAAELADDLDRYRAGQPIQARPTPLWERGVKWAGRQPLAAALLGFCVAVVAISFPLVTVLWLQAESAQAQMQLERDRAMTMARAQVAARREAQELAGRLMLEQAAHLCERGDVPAGLLWLDRVARSDEASPGLRRAAGTLRAGWGQSLYRLHGFASHGDRTVHCAGYSGDGNTLATASGPMVWRWDADGNSLGEPTALPGRVLALEADAEGLLALASGPDGLTLHRLPGGAALGAPFPVKGRVRSAVFSPDRTRLLVGFQEGHARLYDVARREPLFAPLDHGKEMVRAVALSPDGRWAATAGNDGVVRLWSARDGSRAGSFHGHQGPILTVAFSPEGDEVLSGGSADHWAILWRREGGTVTHRFRHEHGVCAVAFQPGGAAIVTGSWDDTARLWHRATGAPLGAPLRHADDVAALAFRRDGRRLVTTSDDGTMRIWDVPTPAQARHEVRHPHRVNVLAVSPDGRTLATACSDAVTRLWPLERRGDAVALDGIGMSVALAFAPDGTALAVGTVDGKLHRRRLPGGEPLGEPIRLPAAVMSVAWSSDGRTIAAGCEDDAPHVFLFAADGTPGRVLRGHGRKVPGLAFSPDGRTLASASWDHTVRRWDVNSGELIGRPMWHQDLVQAVAYSPDGRTLASAGDDYALCRWDAATGQPLGPPVRAPDKLQAVAFDAAGDLIATGDRRGNVRVWEATTGRPAGEVRTHGGEVRTVQFAGDGLWSASWDHTARRWPAAGADGARPLSWLEAHTGLTLGAGGGPVALTAEEWRRRAEGLGR
jgi:WD40 repeat protein